MGNADGSALLENERIESSVHIIKAEDASWYAEVSTTASQALCDERELSDRKRTSDVEGILLGAKNFLGRETGYETFLTITQTVFHPDFGLSIPASSTLLTMRPSCSDQLTGEDVQPSCRLHRTPRGPPSRASESFQSVCYQRRPRGDFEDQPSEMTRTIALRFDVSRQPVVPFEDKEIDI